MSEPNWMFLTVHARVLLCIARSPDARLRDLAVDAGVTERTVFGVVNDLTTAEYVVKVKDGRRNRYNIVDDQPLPDPLVQQRTVGEILALLTEVSDTDQGAQRGGRASR